MGFFKKLFGIGKANPTEKFPKRLVRPQLIWDCGQKGLCGVPLTAPFESLAVFGPSDGHRITSDRSYSLSYADQGLEIDVVGDHVDLYKIFLSEDRALPRSDLGFGRLTCLPSGKVFGPESTPADFASVFGAGRVLYQDEELTAHLFENGDIRFEPAFSPEGKIYRIEIYDNRT